MRSEEDFHALLCETAKFLASIGDMQLSGNHATDAHLKETAQSLAGRLSEACVNGHPGTVVYSKDVTVLERLFGQRGRALAQLLLTRVYCSQYGLRAIPFFLVPGLALSILALYGVLPRVAGLFMLPGIGLILLEFFVLRVQPLWHCATFECLFICANTFVAMGLQMYLWGWGTSVIPALVWMTIMTNTFYDAKHPMEKALVLKEHKPAFAVVVAFCLCLLIFHIFCDWDPTTDMFSFPRVTWRAKTWAFDAHKVYESSAANSMSFMLKLTLAFFLRPGNAMLVKAPTVIVTCETLQARHPGILRTRTAQRKSSNGARVVPASADVDLPVAGHRDQTPLPKLLGVVPAAATEQKPFSDTCSTADQDVEALPSFVTIAMSSGSVGAIAMSSGSVGAIAMSSESVGAIAMSSESKQEVHASEPVDARRDEQLQPDSVGVFAEIASEPEMRLLTIEETAEAAADAAATAASTERQRRAAATEAAAAAAAAAQGEQNDRGHVSLGFDIEMQ